MSGLTSRNELAWEAVEDSAAGDELLDDACMSGSQAKALLGRVSPSPVGHARLGTLFSVEVGVGATPTPGEFALALEGGDKTCNTSGLA